MNTLIETIIEWINERLGEPFWNLVGQLGQYALDPIGSLIKTLANMTVSAWNSAFDTYNSIMSGVPTMITDTMNVDNPLMSSLITLARNVSTSAVMPFALFILTLVVCNEIIELVNKHNNLGEITVETVAVVIFKAALAGMLVVNATTVALGIINSGTWVMNNVGGVTSVEIPQAFRTVFIDSFIMVLVNVPELHLVTLVSVLGSLIVALLAWCIFVLIALICAGIVFFVITFRLVTIIVICALAPIPAATLFTSGWMSAWWQGYLKKLISLMLQGAIIVFLLQIINVMFNNMFTFTGGWVDMVKMLVLQVACAVSIVKSGAMASWVVGQV